MPKRLPLVVLSLCLSGLLLPACSPRNQKPPEAEPASERVLPQGKLIGYRASNGVLGWVGVPYAAPPVGELRWRAPRPAKPWQGSRKATETGTACLQRGSWLGGAPAESIGKVFGSEDCLFVNIWAPEKVPDEGLPVMVWIHGGGNTTGHGGSYDFSQMAERFDLVMISFNYRLGGLGWFYQPALWSEGDDTLDRSGNYGLLDQIELLRWVQANIAAFGGDPNRVSIFGESAGGQNTLALMISPLATGLFQGAIAQSGYTNSVEPEEASQIATATSRQTGSATSGDMLVYWLQEAELADSRQAALQQAQTMPPADLAKFLRSLSPDELVMGYYAESDSHGAPIMIQDGTVIPSQGIAAAYRQGEIHPVPLIAGTNRDENNLWLALSPELVNDYFGAFYRPKDEDRYRYFSEYRAKGWKSRGADDPSRWTRAAGGQAFAYRWDWDEEPDSVWGDFSLLVGAAHGLETTFLTGIFPQDGLAGLIFTKSNAKGRLALSRTMQSYWAEFAYTGNPGRGRGEDLPNWTAWDLADGGDKFIILDTAAGGGVRMSKDEVFLEEILIAAADDERAQSEEDICWLVYLNLKDEPNYQRPQYLDWAQGRCADFPPAHFDAKAD
jgi:para-nitrobenzyl esterase